jgi:hypothetical protein
MRHHLFKANLLLLHLIPYSTTHLTPSSRTSGHCIRWGLRGILLLSSSNHNFILWLDHHLIVHLETRLLRRLRRSNSLGWSWSLHLRLLLNHNWLLYFNHWFRLFKNYCLLEFTFLLHYGWRRMRNHLV